MRHVHLIKGVIAFDDGETVEFQLSEESIQRWGNNRSVIADAVDATEIMLEALQTQGEILA